MVKYIGFYIDEKLTTPLNTKNINGKDTPYLVFGNQDVSKKNTKWPFYLLNESTGDIEDLEVTVQPIDNKRDVELIIENSKAPKLPMMGVHRFTVSWRWGENVKAGPLEATLDVKGTIVDELV